jgi:hypothetical protein
MEGVVLQKQGRAFGQFFDRFGRSGAVFHPAEARIDILLLESVSRCVRLVEATLNARAPNRSTPLLCSGYSLQRMSPVPHARCNSPSPSR